MHSASRPKTPVLLWLALAAVLLSSWTHTARAFAGLEPGGAPAWLTHLSPAVGPLAALAVDLGAGALAWAVGARARQGRGALDLWAGVLAFAALGAFANVDAALAVLGDGRQPGAVWPGLGSYDRLRVGALAAALPLLSIYLARVIETAAHDAQAEAQARAPAGAHAAADDPGPASLAALPTGARAAVAAGQGMGGEPEARRAPTAAAPPAQGPATLGHAQAGGERPSGPLTTRPPAAPRAAAAGRAAEHVGGPTPRRGGRRKAGPADLMSAALEAPESTLADLARMLRTPRQTVSRWAAALAESGRLTRDAAGRWQGGQGAGA